MKNTDNNSNQHSNSHKKSTSNSSKPTNFKKNTNTNFKPKLKSNEEESKNNRFEKAKNKPNPHFEEREKRQRLEKLENKEKENKAISKKPIIRTKTDRIEKTDRNETTNYTEKNSFENSTRPKRDFKDAPKEPRNERNFEDKFENKFENKGGKTVFKKADKKFERPVRVAAKNTDFDRTTSNSNLATVETWRLNRYISNSGVCSRREADTLIAKGEISINGKVVKELGYKVRPSDEVTFRGKLLRKEKPVYVLLNKPKDFITTTSDPQGRKTVMDLVQKASTERIYPVGRLDRNTTGLLLFTNDGEMAKKLSHPSFEVQKIYRVELDKPFTEEDMEKLKAGLELEDGLAKADGAAILSPDGFSVGIELHIGKNRIVRRMFAHLGYEVIRLDRTVYAGLTKETLGRGQWRLLNEREIIRLRFFNKRGQ